MAFCRRQNSNTLKHMGGLTLVELLVASAILVLVIVAVVTTVRKAGEMQVYDRHYRMARSFMNSTLESYSSSDYANLTDSTKTGVLDPRNAGTADDLSETLHATVVAGSITGTNSTTINYKKITVTVFWQEPEGRQSVSVDRLVTP